MKKLITPIYLWLGTVYASIKRYAISLLFMSLSDLYRMIAAVLDWRCHRRILSGKAKYDVAFINNLETDLHKSFLGFLRHRQAAFSLRFSMGKSLCRSLIINSSAHDLMKPKSRLLAKQYTKTAIATAVGDGAKIILYAAGTKRLFSEGELDEIRKSYPEVIFTIGDNGTAFALLADVLNAIKDRGIKSHSRIAVLGPNGFLGGATVKFLQALGYNNLLLMSSKLESPYANVHGVELIVACSHFPSLKLTASILARISGQQGVHVIDVCRPNNLSHREFMKCGNVVRQDSGMVYHPDIRYVFTMGARFMLSRLGLSTRTMYGCFGEAVALSTMQREHLRDYDFLSVNDDSMHLVEHAFALAGFTASPVHNYGRPAETVVKIIRA